MKENEPIVIRQCANGFYVTSYHDSKYPETYVFQTFTELANWLSDHFKYRNILVINDEKNK